MTFLQCLTTLVEWEEATVSEEGGSEGEGREGGRREEGGSEGRSREGVSLAASVLVQ